MINNNWITLAEKRNGVDVQRKFAGIETFIDMDNNVVKCHVNYWERELYPNGEIIKTDLKYYSLENLKELINEEENFKMLEKNVLNGFINTLGYNGIINPARETLENISILPVDINNGYALHSLTRQKLSL